MDEPTNLKKWIPRRNESRSGWLFTCGRPGRAEHGTKRIEIGEPTIARWVAGLPETRPLYIISLLGCKRDGYSEYSYYPFRSSAEEGEQPSVKQWFDEKYKGMIAIEEFRTQDMHGIPQHTMEKVTARILDLLASGECVVVMDSAGAERTSRVCEWIGYVPVTTSHLA